MFAPTDDLPRLRDDQDQIFLPLPARLIRSMDDVESRTGSRLLILRSRGLFAREIIGEMELMALKGG